MRCTLDSDKFSQRGVQISKLLKPLLPPTRTLTCFPSFQSRQVVLVPKYFNTSPFATRVPGIRASYIEQWNAEDEFDRRFGLERAYLHLYLSQEGLPEEELVLLHCDPNMARTEPHYSYKAGPHLHISKSEDPLPHVHIGLNHDQLDVVLGSVSNLTKALGSAIKMLDDQVLGAY